MPGRMAVSGFPDGLVSFSRDGWTAKIERQIIEKQRSVDYDITEYPIEVLAGKYSTKIDTGENELYIPSYQREFVWDSKRQSKFIESLMLGLPIPYLFAAETSDGRLEIIDGSQRIRTLHAFITNVLKLRDLEILSESNGITFAQLVPARQRKFLNQTVRMIKLGEQSDEDSKYESSLNASIPDQIFSIAWRNVKPCFVAGLEVRVAVMGVFDLRAFAE